MNYIRQLNEVFSLFAADDRLNPSHISLYMALFQEWNSSRFADYFFINRREMMNAAKIGAKSTYHRCIRELDTWKYLCYYPSNNPYKGSKIKMSVFRTTGEQADLLQRPNEGQDENSCNPMERQLAGRFIKDIKMENFLKGKGPAHQNEVIEFFKNHLLSKKEALTFFNHYQAVGWKMSSGNEILDWQSAAEKWILKLQVKPEKEFHTGTATARQPDRLRTVKEKNYGEPL